MRRNWTVRLPPFAVGQLNDEHQLMCLKTEPITARCTSPQFKASRKGLLFGTDSSTIKLAGIRGACEEHTHDVDGVDHIPYPPIHGCGFKSRVLVGISAYLRGFPYRYPNLMTPPLCHHQVGVSRRGGVSRRRRCG